MLLDLVKDLKEGKMKRLFLVVLFMFLITSITQASVVDKFTGFLTHPRTVAVTDYGSAIGYTYYDARTDAGIWQRISMYNQGETYDEMSNLNHFHYNKNLANLFLILKGYAITMQIRECYNGDMRWKHLIMRQVFQLFLDNFVWHMVYYHARYNEYTVYDSGRLGSRYVIPFPGHEIKIGLSGNQVKFANAVEFGIGVFPLFSFDFPLNFLCE